MFIIVVSLYHCKTSKFSVIRRIQQLIVVNFRLVDDLFVSPDWK